MPTLQEGGHPPCTPIQNRSNIESETSSRSVSGPARLFIALPLPTDLAASVERWRSGRLGDRWQPVAVQNLHLTLAFLGSAEPKRFGPVADAVRDSRPPHTVEVSLGPACVELPPRRPRALAIEASSPAATELAGRLSAALAAAGIELERRPFRPHVTIARGRRDDAERESTELASLPAHLGTSRPWPELVLFRSEPGPDGPSYLPEITVSLER